MKIVKKILLFIMVAFMILPIVGCSKRDFGPTGEFIVTAKQAVKMIENKDAILIDVSSNAEYLEGHIKGAINIPFESLTVNEPYENMLPEAVLIEQVMGAAGLTEKNMLIVYDRASNMHASRFLWTLNMFGNFNVKVISGGYDLLVEAKAETTKTASTLPLATYVAGDKEKKIIVSLDYLKVVSNDEDVIIIDARSADELKAGKIPNSIHLFFAENNYVNGEFQSIKNIQLIYLKKGLSPDTKVIVYCHKGVRSAQTYVALKNAGFKDVRLYDGAWLEYFDVESPAPPSGDTGGTTPPPSGGCGG